VKAPLIFGKPATLTENLGASFIVWRRWIAKGAYVEVYRLTERSRAKKPWSGVLIIGTCGHVVLTHGRTRAEAVRNLERCVREFFAAMRKVRL
jgi:hypothetical protein